MTNFEKLKSDESIMAFYMDCPYRAVDALPQCEEKFCLECCIDWLNEEAQDQELSEVEHGEIKRM